MMLRPSRKVSCLATILSSLLEKPLSLAIGVYPEISLFPPDLQMEVTVASFHL